MSLSRFTIATIAASVVLVGCGGEDTSSDTSTTTPTPVPSESSAPTDGEGPTTSSCVGIPGDGTGAELSAVELKHLGDNLQVTYQLEEALPSGDEVLYTVDAWDMDGEKGYQLGVEVNRRGQQTQYLLAFPDETRSEVDGDLEKTGNTMEATYPMDMLESLGKKFQWSATVKIGADPADSCPSVGDDPLVPERVIFSK